MSASAVLSRPAALAQLPARWGPGAAPPAGQNCMPGSSGHAHDNGGHVNTASFQGHCFPTRSLGTARRSTFSLPPSCQQGAELRGSQNVDYLGGSKKMWGGVFEDWVGKHCLEKTRVRRGAHRLYPPPSLCRPSPVCNRLSYWRAQTAGRSRSPAWPLESAPISGSTGPWNHNAETPRPSLQ